MTRRLDRTGEPLGDDPVDECANGPDRASAGVIEPAHDERCRDGWLGYDDEMRPIPCLVCRPRLRTTLRSTSGLIR